MIRGAVYQIKISSLFLKRSFFKFVDIFCLLFYVRSERFGEGVKFGYTLLHKESRHELSISRLMGCRNVSQEYTSFYLELAMII